MLSVGYLKAWGVLSGAENAVVFAHYMVVAPAVHTVG